MFQSRRPVVTLCVVAVLLLSTLGAGVGSVAAQDEEVPSLPAVYYGDLTVSDGSLDGPVVIDAVADGEIQDSIRVDADGSIGGPAGTDAKLSVQEPDNGSISFQIGGEPLTIQSLDGSTVESDSIPFDSGTQEIELQIDSLSDIDPAFSLSITGTNSPVEPSETLTVTTEITNEGPTAISPNVSLQDPSNTVVASESVDIPLDETASTTLSWTPTEDDAGTQTLTVVAGDQTALTDVEIESPTIADPTPGGEGGGGQGGVPGGPSPDDDETTSDTDPTVPGLVNTESQFIVSSEQFGLSQVRFTDATALARITWETSDIPSELTTVDTYNQTPANVSPVPGDMISVSDVSVPNNATTEPATLAFRVDRTALDDRSVTADSVTVARLTDDGWEPLSTTVADEDTDRVLLEAETPGFSYFAVTTTDPTAVIDAPTTVAAGSEVTLSGANSTTPFGEIANYEWTIDGESRTGANTTTQVDGETAVELTVVNDAGENATTTTTLTTTSGNDAPGFGALTALVALIGSVGLLVRRRHQG